MNVDQITTILSSLIASFSVFAALYYVHTKSDERWARLLESFTDFKNITVSRFAELEKAIDKKQDRT